MNVMHLTREELARLTSTERAQLEARAHALMTELGVNPVIDQQTGRRAYQSDDVERALGLSSDDARQFLAMLGFVERDFPNVDFKPLQ